MLLFYFVASKDGLVNSVERPFTSSSLHCGESPWEGRVERDDGEVTADVKSKVLENTTDFKTQMVSQHLFLYIGLCYSSLSRNKAIKAWKY